ncbi:hypothetical protein BBF96_14850 [Anoxybacter fermentans]|uniref:HTH merR-type domain-containing protein n=1 Tax=Anoxybacter fermentans TaxID=1323375 RepID=A0A3S9T1S5_9FIRM|nr:helix-turn-helix domain-containing protein [Anoxybacter fermentans]AZR74553.1 hypothetical protein BBF96_14850 [Anoxybacter fermentans]
MNNRNRPMYTMSAVCKMTGLTARRIRYYEEVGLIKPARTRGNQRIFTPEEIQRLREIKELLEKGLTIAGVKEQLALKDQSSFDYTPIEPAKTLPGMQRGITSLYPVSNRAQLLEMILKQRKEKKRNKEKI